MNSATHESLFEEIFDQHKSKILRFCSNYTESPEDREDLFQEVLINIWRSLPTFEGRSNITTWVYKVALRVSMRFSQKKTRKRGLSRPLDGLDISSTKDDHAMKRLEREEEIKKLRA